MAINFPSSPALNDTYTYNGRTYRYSAQGTWDRIGTAVTSSDTDPGVIEVADQSEMEAASSTTLAVTPGRMQYHPGVSKAWVSFNGTGTPTALASRNIASITDNGAGDYTLNFTTAFSSANYAFAGGVKGSANNDTDYQPTVNATGGKATGSMRIIVNNESTGTATDLTDVNLIFFGDQ